MIPLLSISAAARFIIAILVAGKLVRGGMRAGMSEAELTTTLSQIYRRLELMLWKYSIR